mgnify:CR=1 FL=1
MNDPDTLTARLDDMEVRLTFIDEAVQALTDADAGQSRRIEQLERVLHELRNELSALRTAQAPDVHDEPPPPHY